MGMKRKKKGSGVDILLDPTSRDHTKGKKRGWAVGGGGRKGKGREETTKSLDEKERGSINAPKTARRLDNRSEGARFDGRDLREKTGGRRFQLTVGKLR